MKKIEILEHGNYLYGTLDGVDFTAKGSMYNEKTNSTTEYGNSVKLKFITKQTTSKSSNGVILDTKTVIAQIIRINCNDDNLVSIVNKYNALIGKDFLIKYSIKDGFTSLSDSIVEI